MIKEVLSSEEQKGSVVSIGGLFPFSTPGPPPLLFDFGYPTSLMLFFRGLHVWDLLTIHPSLPVHLFIAECHYDRTAQIV